MTLKVIYIMGSGRSGSTLLDIVLGSQSAVFGTGELCNMVEAMDSRHSYCSCGVVSTVCPLWTAVRRAWVHTLAGSTADDYVRLQGRHERLRSVLRYRRRHPDDPLLPRYLTQTQALFEVIGQASGSTTIIDSSKHPMRALALSRMQGVDLRVIHLVRDVRGVACSMMRSWESDPAAGIMVSQPGSRSFRIAVDWLLTNAVANRVRARLGERAILVRYEDLVMAPTVALDRISRLSGVDFGSVAMRLDQGETLCAGHNIEGNRLRLEKKILLKPDTRWQAELSPVQQRLLPILAAPVALGYGYRPW